MALHERRSRSESGTCQFADDLPVMKARLAPESSPVEVSFVIPCYRCSHSLAKTVASILGQQSARSIEVLVVVSGTEEDPSGAPQPCPGVRVLQSPGRLVPGAARNWGVRESRGDLVAFLDADAVAAPEWLETLLRALESQPRMVMAGAAVANANPETAASQVLHWAEFSDFLEGMPSGPRSFLSSSNLLVRRREFVRAGAFNESMAMAEDLLLSASLQGRLYFEGGTRILHRHRSRWPEVRTHLRRLGFWSGRLRRNYPSRGDWLRKVPWSSAGLPFYRLLQVSRRVLRARPRQAGLLARRLPLLWLGLCHWSAGFYEGLRGTDGSSREDPSGWVEPPAS